MSKDYNLDLPAQLDMVYAGRLKGLLCDAINQAETIRPDAEAVVQVGSSCIQLMVAAARALGAGDDSAEGTVDFLEST